MLMTSIKGSTVTSLKCSDHLSSLHLTPCFLLHCFQCRNCHWIQQFIHQPPHQIFLHLCKNQPYLSSESEVRNENAFVHKKKDLLLLCQCLPLHASKDGSRVEIRTTTASSPLLGREKAFIEHHQSYAVVI